MKKMLLLGDSINLHYGSYLADFLKDAFTISSKPGRAEALKRIDHAVGGNGGDSAKVLEYIREREAANDLDFDVFLFNCGLHDIKRKIPEEKAQVPIDEYERNLEAIYAIMEAHGVKCAFITTTQVMEKEHCELVPGGVKRYNADVRAYSDVAAKVAAAHNAPVIDLGGFTGSLGEDIYLDYAHFDVPTRKLQAAFIAGNVLGLVKKGVL